MTISIITAVYNRQETIGAALDSVQAQSFSDIEHIISDGGSTDGTIDIIEDRKRKNSLIRLFSGPDNGIYDALNKGIKRASGVVVGLMHSDDFFASETVLEKIAAAFEDQSIDGVYGDLQYVSSTNSNRIIRHWHPGPYSLELLKRGWMPPHPTLYLRREVFERWGYYNTSYQISADYDAMLRWLVQGQIRLAYIPEVLVKMRVGGESNKSLGRILKKSLEDYRAIRGNGVGGFGTLALKNTRKIGQFFIKDNP